VAQAAYPSMKGEFSLNIQEPGDYVLQAYFAGRKVGPATPVTVAAADIDLKVPVKVNDGSAAADDKPKASDAAAEPKEGAK